MRTTTLITAIALLLPACHRPEEGIDDTRIRGIVRIDPFEITEADDGANEDMAGAQALPPISYGHTFLSGTISNWVMTESASPDIIDGNYNVIKEASFSRRLGPRADEDWYGLSSNYSDEEYTLTIDFPDVTWDTLYLVQLRDLADLSLPGGMPAILWEDWSNDPHVEITFSLEAGHAYALVIGGGKGTGELGYTVHLPARHPDEADILVGAYLPCQPEQAEEGLCEDGGVPDTAKRGRPVAGAKVDPFESVGPYSFEGTYEMFLVRYVEDVVDPDAEVDDTGDPPMMTVTDESVDEVYIYGGDWPNLNAKLPAGTWYSPDPVYLELSGPKERDRGEDVRYYPAETVHVTDLAPVVIGWQQVEEEPNNLVYTMTNDPGSAFDFADVSGAQDLGEMSGGGFVDVLTGDQNIPALGEGGWAEEHDAFLFTVAEPVEILWTLDWDNDGTDLDFAVYHIVEGEGELVGLGYYGKPQLNDQGGPFVYEPGNTYAFAIMTWEGPVETPNAWEMRMEQGGV